VFQDYHLDHPSASRFALAAASALVEDKLAPGGLEAFALEQGITELGSVKSDTLDLILYYIRHALIDHALSPEEIESVRRLKRLFHIEEGDFWQYRRPEVGDIVALEMERILADKVIDRAEELHQVALQGFFDLSYDQYLELTKEQVANIVDAVLEAVETDDTLRRRQREELKASISHLMPLYELQQLIQTHHIEQYLPNRVITQKVKDEVWRRDSGRCVSCGGQDNLEFDHIIPFSKGGASTYRNVQLLCQTCNRRKSATIG